MEISADLDARAQEQQSRNFRREGRRLAGFDFSKTWAQLQNEGNSEAIVSSASLESSVSIRYRFNAQGEVEGMRE